MTHIQSTIDKGGLLRSNSGPEGDCAAGSDDNRPWRRYEPDFPAVLMVFTATLALSAVVIMACAQDPAPTESLEPTAATPHGSAYTRADAHNGAGTC